MRRIAAEKHSVSPGWLAAATACLALCGSNALAQTASPSGAHPVTPRVAAPHPPAPRVTSPTLHHAPTAPSRVRTWNGSTPRTGYSGVSNPAYQDTAAPRPTWEMPRTVTPQWEIPSYNPVQPNPVQGNPVERSRGYGYGFGYAPGYYIDPLALAGTDQTDQPDPNDVGQQGPLQQQETPGLQNAQGDVGMREDAHPARAPYRGQGAIPVQPFGSGGGPSTRANAGPVTDGLDHPEVTLVFNDGRPPLKVHSYAVTASSIFIAEGGHQRQIPLSALDLNATVERNRDAGVDFSIPGSR